MCSRTGITHPGGSAHLFREVDPPALPLGRPDGDTGSDVAVDPLDHRADAVQRVDRPRLASIEVRELADAAFDRDAARGRRVADQPGGHARHYRQLRVDTDQTIVVPPDESG